MKKGILLLFYSIFISAPVVRAQSANVENVDKSTAVDLIKTALAARNLTIETQDSSTQDLLSSYFTFKSRLTAYRARYRFHVEENSVTVSLYDIGGLKTSDNLSLPIPPSAGAKQEQLGQIVDSMNKLKGAAKPVTNAGSTGATPQTAVARGGAAPDMAPGSHMPQTDKAVTLMLDSFDPGCACREGLCPVLHGGRWGFVDREGKPVIDFVIKSGFFHGRCPSFSEGLALVPTDTTDADKMRTGNNEMFIDKKGGRQFQNYSFIDATSFHEGMSIVHLVGKPNIPYLMDHQGKLTPLPQVNGDYVGAIGEQFHEGLLRCRVRNGAYAFVNLHGEIAFTLREGTPHTFSDGLVWVLVSQPGGGSNWGAVDKKGNTVIPFMYSKEPIDFSEGMAAVSDKMGHIGFIDKANTLKTPCQFSGVISSFRGGYAMVSVPSGGFAVIDKNGSILKKMLPMDIHCNRSDNLCTFPSNRGWGLMETNGNIILPAAYFTDIGEFGDGLDGLATAKVIVNRNKVLEGYINIHGDFVVLKGESQF